jgi:large repetitive protein
VQRGLDQDWGEGARRSRSLRLAGRAQNINMSESTGTQGSFPRFRTSRFGGRVLRSVGALGLIVGVTASAIVGLSAGPAAAATAPTWATGQYFDAIQNVPFCDDVSISNSAALPLTSITAGATPSGFTNYSIKDVNLAAGTAQVCGTDTNTPVSSGTPPNLAPVATNSGGSATDGIPIGSYGACTWTSGAGTVKAFDANQDLYQTGTQSAFGASITNGETLGSTSNYATCTDAMVSAQGSGGSGLGDAWTVNTANPLPTPTDNNPSASQGDLASSNLFLNSGGCYGSVNISSGFSYSNFGSGTTLTTPTPWVNGGECKYGSLGDNEAGGNTDSFATCPPTQSDVDAGLVSCTIIASSGNDENGSINYSSDDLFYTGQAVPQQSTATLSTGVTGAGGTVAVTGGTNWWGSADGAPNSGPYGDDQNGAGTFYQVSAPSVYIGTSRATAVPVVNSTVTIPADAYTCTGAESDTVGPNPCTFTAGQPTGSFQVPAGLTPGTYNVYIDETNTTPLPGNGPSDSYQTARGTNLGTAESVTQLTIGTAPSITSANNTTFTAGSAGTFSVTTSGSPSPALSETGALPSGVTFADNGNGTATLSGTPAAGTGGTYGITITANDGVSPNATQSFTLTVDQAPAITSAAGTTFVEGSSGHFSVTTSGVPTAALSETGVLPTGVGFVDNGNGTGTLSGTPAAGTRGSYGISITANNGITPNGMQSFTLTVNAAPTITSTNSTTFTAGSAGTFMVTTAGQPAPALSETGTLPTGVGFIDNGNGTAALSGTPAAGTGGSYEITITANNGIAPNATQSFTLTVDQAPAITSASSTTFTVGSAGTFTVTTTGPPAPALSETGALPSGVTFNDNGDGTATLAGTPAAGTGGSYSITITADNGIAPSATQSFTLTVDQAPGLTSASSTTFTVGSAGTFTVTTSGNPAPALSRTGGLPSGVTFNDNGDGTATLSGTPAAGTGGTYSITITANNGITPNATQSFTLTVDQIPAITSTSGTTFTEGVSSSFTVATTGTPTPGLTETGSLPSGVTFVDNGNGTATLSGTPSASGNFPITITAANGVGSAANQSFTLDVTSVAQAPYLTSNSATTFTEGSAGSFTVTATGKPTPTLSETGSLPSGVTFSDNGNGTATLVGTPTTNGSYPLTITAANGVNPNAIQSFTLTVDQAPAITSGNSATFTEGSSGTFTVTTAGYPTPALSKTGSLPSGVSFSDNGNGTATLSGTPAAGTRGSYGITVKASNGLNPNATQAFTLTVDAAPAITSAGSASFTVGSSGSFTVTSTGNPTATVAEAGSLPSGVTFVAHANGTATLSGTPAEGSGGSYPLTITASNGVSPSASQSFTLTVEQAPAITSASTATFTEGSSGTFTVTSTGSPTSAMSESGSLPAGVTFDDNGNGTATLSGTPAAGTRGSYPVTLRASNGVGNDATQSFTLTVDAVPAITSANSTTFTVGSAGSFTVTTTGTPTPAISETGSLPAGVSLVDNGNGTAALSGTPDPGTGGSYVITIGASNGVSPDASQAFTLTVDQAPSVTSAGSAMFAEGSANSFTVTTTGYPTSALSESGSLPAGVTFSDNGNGTATLSGTPTAGGNFPVTITANNGISPNATQSFSLTVGSAPAFTSADQTTFTLGGAGSFTVTATGNPTPTISDSGTLPHGVTFSGNQLSGTPTQAGTFQIGFVANNGVSPQAVQDFTLTVAGLKITTTSPLPSATIGTPYSQQLTATGGNAPLKWSKSGSLPKGLKLSKSGLLSGTPSSKAIPGTYSFSIKVTDASKPKQTATATFNLTVNS